MMARVRIVIRSRWHRQHIGIAGVALLLLCHLSVERCFLSFSLAAKPVRTHSILGVISWDRVGEVYMTKSWPLFVLVSVR